MLHRTEGTSEGNLEMCASWRAPFRQRCSQKQEPPMQCSRANSRLPSRLAMPPVSPCESPPREGDYSVKMRVAIGPGGPVYPPKDEHLRGSGHVSRGQGRIWRASI